MSGFVRYNTARAMPNIQQVPTQTIASAGGSISPGFVFTGGDVVLMGFAAQSTGTFLTRLRLQNEFLDYGQMENTSFWGTAQQPTWCRGKFIADGSMLEIFLQDTSGSPGNAIDLTLFTRYANADDETNLGFGLGACFMTVDQYNVGVVCGSNANGVANVTVEPGAHFSPDAMIGSLTNPSIASSLGVLVNYRDVRANTKCALSQQPIPWPSIFGSQNFPFVFPPMSQPIFRANSSVSFQLINTAGANTGRPLLIGRRVQGETAASWYGSPDEG